MLHFVSPNDSRHSGAVQAAALPDSCWTSPPADAPDAAVPAESFAAVARVLLRTLGGSDHVNPAKPRAKIGSASTERPAQGGPARRLLVVEPEDLVRWSLATYLAKWFTVDCVDCRAKADRILNERSVDAVVVSDDLSNDAVQAIEARARSRNPSVRVVCTVTNPSHENESTSDTLRVEKPFALSQLASMLGVTDVPAGRE